MASTVIRVNGLSKRYRIGVRERYGSLRDVIAQTAARPFHAARNLLGHEPASTVAPSQQFWALRDVSFEVKRGEILGVIGHNGAGKTTLLKILSRIVPPTEGEVAMRGRLASLLEVGTGFHWELTGRENVYLNGAILGMKRAEIDRKFDEIVDFAEVRDFLDTPVKHYSSGMYLRLAFAVAAHLEPNILLIDEVLAVGDAAFQKKCLGKMGEVASAGRTILFVSHNMAAVQQLTQTCLLLDHGRVASYGPTPQVLRDYLSLGPDRSATVYELEAAPRRYPELTREVEFLRAELLDAPTKMLQPDQPLHLRFTVRGNEDVAGFRFSITIFSSDGTPVGNVFGPPQQSIHKGEVAVFDMSLSDLRLARGSYYCAVATGLGSDLDDRVEFDIIVDVLGFEVLGPLRPDGVMSEWMSVWGQIRFQEPRVERVA
jgi:lipopolysaccharide transport system ATP-binding protein